MLNKSFLYFILIVSSLNLAPLFVFSQESANLGTNFYVAFGKTGLIDVTDINVTFQIKIYSTESCQVTFTFTANGTSQIVNIPANSIYVKNFTPNERQLLESTNTGINSKSLQIQSTKPIQVFAYTQQYQGADIAEVFPTDKLGTNYFHLSYKVLYYSSYTRKEGFLAIATQNNTTLTYCLPNNSQSNTVILQTGEVFAYLDPVTDNIVPKDISGTHILSDKPIALYTHPVCSSIQDVSCDCLYEQHLSIDNYGKQFFVPTTHRGKERVRILASEDGTTISQIGGTIVPTFGIGSLNLNKGQFVEFEITLANKGIFIESNKPVLVGSYIYGHDYGGNGLIDPNGDPSLVYVPAINQYENSEKISPFMPISPTTVTQHYAIITTVTATKNETTEKIGTETPTSLSGGIWYDNISAGYSYYIKPINTSATIITEFENPHGLIVLGYGTGAFESYLYCAGRKYIMPTNKDTIDISICHGENFHGYSNEGVFCEDTICYNVTILPNSFSTINATICEGETYTQNGFNENTTGTYTKTVQATNGCDSIITLYLTVNNKFTNIINATICEGETYTQNGFSENMTGTFVKNLTTINGCDSIVTLNLLVTSQTPIIEKNVTICYNNNYTEPPFNITNITENHIYYDTLPNINGCDSIIKLNLTVLPIYRVTIYDTICQGADYNMYGFSLKNVEESSTFELILQTINGCDSIINLNLNVIVPQVNIIPRQSDFCKERTMILTAETEQQNIIWSNGSSTNSITVTDFGIYTVTVNAGENCNNSTAEFIVSPCFEDLFIPNCFTPNEDGINDTWVIDNISLFDMFEIHVFNRWGQKLYECRNNYEAWDGKYNGKKIPTGTYMYIVMINKNFNFCGTLTVIY